MSDDLETEGVERLLPADAARFLGVSKPTLLRYADNGVIKCHTNDKGHRFFDKDDLEAFKESRNGSDQVAVLTANQNEFIVTVTRHVKETFDLMHAPSIAVLGILKDENAALRVRCNELEKVNTDLIKAREDALSQQHERDMIALETANAHERKTEVISILKDVAGPLKNAVAASVGGGDDKVAAMMQFLTALDRDKVKMILAAGLLDSEEESALRNLLAKFDIKLEDDPEINKAVAYEHE